MRVVMLVHNDMQRDARVDREAAALASSGHEVTVLALRGADASDVERRSGFEIHRVAEATSSTWRKPRRKVSEALTRRSKFVDAAARLNPDVVHCHDTDTLPTGWRVAGKTGASLVYDAHELFPDMLEGHGAGPLAVRYWRRVERSIVPRCDAVICVNAERGTVLASRYGVQPVIVRNLPDLEPVIHTGRLRSELPIAPHALVLLYQGVLNKGRGLENMIRACSGQPDVALVLQGDGTESAMLRELTAGLGLESRVHFTGWVSPDDLHEYACDADCGIVTYEPTSLNNRLAAPNKLWSYMMAGICVIACDFPGLRAIVEGEDIGYLFDPERPGSIAEAINRIIAHPGDRVRKAEHARRVAETSANWEIESQRLTGLYQGIADRRASSRQAL